MATATASAQRQRVLIVEDESVVAADLRATIEDLGYEVVGIAETGQKALQLAEETRPELVLMDIQLRGAMDGTAAAATMRRRWQLPVVFLTANGNERTLARARAVGPYGCLLKPFRAQELNTTMLLAIEQHRSTRELFAEGAWLRTVLDSLSDGVLVTDTKGNVCYMNPSVEQLIGRRFSEVHGKAIEESYDLWTTTGARVKRSRVRDVLEAETPMGRERYFLRPHGGQAIPVEDSVSPVFNAGEVGGAVVIVQNIAERVSQEELRAAERDRLEGEVKKTSEALGESRAELKALSAHLITTQEQERWRLARELHDDFGQQTAILGIHLESALKQLHQKPQEAEDLLRGMRQDIAQLSQGLREASHRLHPSVLEDLGLAAALRSLVLAFRDDGGEVSYSLPEKMPEVELKAATALYRIAQEALRNAKKHAPGAPIHLKLSSSEEALELTIRDAGPGFNLAHARIAGGLGLLSMHERARLAHGTFQLNSRPGEGTIVCVNIPH